jgi:hypothetical protein
LPDLKAWNIKNKTTMKKAYIVLIIGFLGIFLVYDVIVPAKMKSDVPGMVKYLDHEGYKNAKYKSMKTWCYQVNFTSDKGEISVRYSNNGIYNIVY